MSAARAFSPGRSAGRAAFTLIEIMVVLVLIGLLGGLVVPRMMEMSDFYLSKSAREMAGIIQTLYNRAAINQMTYVLSINLDEKQYQVFACEKEAPKTSPGMVKTGFGAPESEKKEEKPIFAKKGEEEKSELDLRVTINGKDDELNVRGTCAPDEEMGGPEPTKLHETLLFKALALGHRQGLVTSGRDMIVFWPTGTMSKATIYLATEGDDIMAVTAHPLTGAVEVTRELGDFESELADSARKRK